MGSYVLQKRLDVLGIQKTYLREDYPILEGKERDGTSSSWWPISLLKDIPLRNDSGVRGEYILRDKKFLGGHGEVWLARRVLDSSYIDAQTSYILKRMHVAGRPDILRCAQREIHFGLVLSQHPRSTRFITSFEIAGDYWLVFRDEGVSLQQLLYAVSISSDNGATSPPLLQPSAIWRKLRTTQSGSDLMKALLLQVITGVNELHHLNILHRDIKPSNLLLNAEDASNPRLIVADYSSAVSADALPLYGSEGPTTDEESEQYIPPEVTLQRDRRYPYDPHHSYAYDAWSIGVLFLEMILGTADVFSVDQRTAALISHRMRHHSGEDIDRALWLASMAEFCIYSNSDFGESTSPALMPLSQMRPCGLSDLARAIHRRDPLGIGYADEAGLDLLSRLLKWSPAERISLDEALQHAYFVGVYESALDGSSHYTSRDRDAYDVALTRSAMSETDEEILYLDTASAGQSAVPEAYSIRSLAHPVRNLMNVTHRTHDKNETWRHLLTPPVANTCSSSQLGAPTDLNTADIDMDLSPTIVFQCPKCNRTFFDDWTACHHHIRARKHGDHCVVANREDLPHCLSDHALLPIDQHSGWCDLIGRRKRIEDAHAVHITSDYLFLGVFDGHWGSAAAKFASRHVPLLFDKLMRSNISAPDVNISSTHLVADKAFIDEFVVNEPLDAYSSQAVKAMYYSITLTQHDFLTKMSDAERSGSTVTTAAVFQDMIVVANVGDSRAVLCCDSYGTSVALTEDHTPMLPAERHRVEASGGFISEGQTKRVNGQLAVTRSIGNAALVHVLSSIPDIAVVRRHPLRSRTCEVLSTGSSASSCVQLRYRWSDAITVKNSQQLFLIVASDGLWDVMTNQEAVDFVCSFLLSALSNDQSLPPHSFQDAAKMLAQEAFVRGSTDNIGVCIADIMTTSFASNRTTSAM